jgi:diacylglycerol O-acyltransferase-1
MYHPLIGSFAMSLSIILCMKIISYHVVNAELRQRWKERIGEDPYPDCPYPKNITLRNVAYFWVAPTLCYQPTYPLIEAFRPKFFIKRLVELGAALAMMHILTDQYAIPTVKNSMKPINELNLMGMIERLLKLSISSLYIWLLAFYALFHSFLNAFAELVRFGDRMFYKSWWNAKSFEEYWRLWNAPVHQWLKRHIYFPMRARGWSSSTSQVSIFVISAMAHELLVGVPTHVLEGWAFFAMIFQIPLVAATGWFTRLKPNSSAGNFFFWICFCIVGQPMIVLLYYRSWINRIL